MTSYAETALVRGLAFLSETQASLAHNLANLDSTGFKRQSAVAKTETSRFQSVLDAELPTVSFAQTIDWTPGSPAPFPGPGVYFLRLTAGGRSASARIVFAR